jgi:hypothetical protein
MPTMSWTCFPGIHNVAESFNELQNDICTLLGYEPSKQVEVVDKIESFLGKMAHKVIIDMGVHASLKQTCGHVVQ